MNALRLLIILILINCSHSLFSQNNLPEATWEVTYENIGNSKYLISLKAQIPEKWFFVSDYITFKKRNSKPLKIRFDDNDKVTFLENYDVGEPKKYSPRGFGEVLAYSNEFERKFLIKVHDINEPISLNGHIYYTIVTNNTSKSNQPQCFKVNLNDLKVMTISIGNKCLLAKKKE